MKSVSFLFSLAVLSWSGCGASDQDRAAQTPAAAPAAPTVAAPATPDATAATEATATTEPAPTGDAAMTDPATTIEAEPANVERQRAEAGAGAQGRGYGGGVYTEPIRNRFRAEQRIIYEVQIPHSLDLFKATNGRAPKSHEEFMEQIIAPAQIQLPELPAGERYVYDPATEELMVERPAP